MKIYKNMIELVGRTPLVELTKIEDKLGLKARVVVKLERFNPGGSVKDRAALSMIESAEKVGSLQPGWTIVEPTSGNTGIALAWIGAIKGYKVKIVMPDTMSVERRMLMMAYGAELILTPGKDGIKGAIAEAERICREDPRTFMPSQFDNPANVEAHLRTTAKEIEEDTDGNTDIIVAGVGTGGTLSGTARGLKTIRPEVKAVAVEPVESPVLSGGQPGSHKIQGIGAGFVPGNYDKEVVDEILQIDSAKAMETARMLAQEEGMLVGISSGAAAAAAIELAKRPENEGKLIVAVLPDTGERYLSMM